MHSDDSTVQPDELEQWFLDQIDYHIWNSHRFTNYTEGADTNTLYFLKLRESFTRKAEGNAIEARRLLKKLDQYRRTKPKKRG